MSRHFALFALAVLAVGCSSGSKDPGSASVTSAPAANTAAVVPGTVRILIKGVYLGCEPSQQAARQALAKLPGVTDLIIDPAARTIFCRIPLANYEKARIAAMENLKLSKPILGVAYTPLAALATVGLSGKAETPDQVDSLLSELGAGIPIRDQPSDKVVMVYGVFAGSATAKKAIQVALAPHQVTFMGAGEQQDIRIVGINLDEHELMKQLVNAGFYGTI